jgi:hypothetical protein
LQLQLYQAVCDKDFAYEFDYGECPPNLISKIQGTAVRKLRFPRSRSTVGAEVKCSNDLKLSALIVRFVPRPPADPPVTPRLAVPLER